MLPIPNNREAAESCINYTTKFLQDLKLDDKERERNFKKLTEAKKFRVQEYIQKISEISDHHKNMPCASNALELEYNKEFGRHIKI